MDFESQMLEFENLTAELNRKGFIQEYFAENAFLIRGSLPSWTWGQKDIALTVMALIHGNEVGGLAVANHLLSSILHGNLRPLFPIAFVIGNVEAGYRKVRFTEKDLNRVFGTSSMETYEDRRAKKIERLLKRSCFVLDFHQTIEATTNPFFIFGLEERSLAFAQFLAPEIPIITYSISERRENGLVATGYSIENGGIAVTLELGQCGFDPSQITLGLKVAEKAIHFLNESQEKVSNSLHDILHPNVSNQKPLLVFGLRILNEGDSSELVPGLTNFADVHQGQKLGRNSHGEIISPMDGKILFPKYGKSKLGSKELCVILQERSLQSLL